MQYCHDGNITTITHARIDERMHTSLNIFQALEKKYIPSFDLTNSIIANVMDILFFYGPFFLLHFIFTEEI